MAHVGIFEFPQVVAQFLIEVLVLGVVRVIGVEYSPKQIIRNLWLALIGVIPVGHKVPIVLETLRLVIRFEAVLHHLAH